MSGQSNQPVSLVGDRLGHYVLIHLLDESHNVYLAHRLDNSKIKVVIKIVDKQHLDDEEAKIILGLSHSHIVGFRDFCIENDIRYFVMEYITGGTLRAYYNDEKKLSLQKIVSYIRQIADALQYLHKKEIIHRDVKLENILMRNDREVVLCDFDIARLNEIPHKTAQDTRKLGTGTLSHMAPECFRSEPCPASDQYALGIVAYEMLAGNLPFQGKTHEEIAYQHLMQPPPSFRKKRPDIPADVEKVVKKALAKRPEDRYPSVQEFAEALERASLYGVPASNGDTILARLRLLTSGFQRLFTRREAIGGLMGLVVGAVGSEIATYLFGRFHPSPPIAPATPRTSIGTPIRQYKHSNVVTAVALSPDGKRVVSADRDGHIQIQSVDNGVKLAEANSYRSSVEDVAWSPTGDQIAYASNGRLHLLDAATGKSISEPFDPGYAGQALAVAWWEEHLFFGLGEVVLVFDSVLSRQYDDKDSPYRGHKGRINAITCSPDTKNTVVASASDDFTVQLWMAETSTSVFSYQGHNHEVRTTVWSPDGNWIASGGNDWTVQVWHAQGADIGKTLSSYSEHTDAVNALAWHHDNQYIASGSDDGTVHLWRVSDGCAISVYRGHTGNVNAVAWSRHGLVVSGGHDGTVQIWQAF